MEQQPLDNKLVNRFFRKLEKDPYNEIIPSRPGRYSRWIFPLLGVITAIVIWLLWWIHHPEIINGYAVLTTIDAADQMLQVELDNPRGPIAHLRQGQMIRIKAAGKNTQAVPMLRGRVDTVTVGGKDKKMLANIRLGGGGINGPVARAVFRRGADLDLVIVVNDMPLLMRILHTSANTISGNN